MSKSCWHWIFDIINHCPIAVDIESDMRNHCPIAIDIEYDIWNHSPIAANIQYNDVLAADASNLCQGSSC